MLYTAYEFGHQAVAPYRAFARLFADYFDSPLNPARETWFGRTNSAALKVYEAVTRRYGKPEWNLPKTTVNDIPVDVTVETVTEKPFGSLIRFRRDPQQLAKARGAKTADPRLLIVAPMSGHYATLLRGTAEAMLPTHEVFITDWADARQVPAMMGRFDLDTYIDYLIDFIQTMGPGAHAMAVCQPGPALLAATSIMAHRGDPATPRTMTFIGSPIDARKSPTVTNLLAEQRTLEWFQKNMIQTVPLPYAGAGRQVYPGFLQLFSFMSMNADRHVSATWDYFENLVKGDGEPAEKHERFYDEYLSVCDMTAEFYLQTIHDVFQEYLLPRGLFLHHGEIVNPSCITNTALLTIEGELDDISGIGQTQAAHDLCTGIKAQDKEDYVQKGAGHYGVFSGSKYRNIIQPKIAGFIQDRFDMAEERRIPKAMQPANERS